MTAQIADRVHFAERTYAIAGICGNSLFNPQQIGITPISISTACWRGYHCDYIVEDQHLSLARLVIGIRACDVKLGRIRIFGQAPRLVRDRRSAHDDGIGIGPAEYEIIDTRQSVKFTGGLLLGDDFLPELYVHMGFHPAYKFKHVVELVFDDGRMTHAFDRSEQAEYIRNRIQTSGSNRMDNPSTEDIRTFIEEAFSFDYDLSRFFKN